MSHWIGQAIQHPGALHRQLGVPQGQKIPTAELNVAANAGGKLGKRARLAETLRGMHSGMRPAGHHPHKPTGKKAGPDADEITMRSIEAGLGK